MIRDPHPGDSHTPGHAAAVTLTVLALARIVAWLFLGAPQ